MSDPAPGLQAERTALAWSRTSLALLANGALVLLRHLQPDGRPVEVVLAGVAAALAVVVALVGRSRSRALLRGGPAAAGRAIVPLGVLVAVFCLVTTATLAG